MIVTLLRPSPQVPKPSARSAQKCFAASSENIKGQSRQMAAATVDITWIFLLTIFQALNTVLWSISYPEVRAFHTKEELEDLIDMALDTIHKCRERWPGTAAASQLYAKLAKACLRSYDNNSSHPPSSLSANSPSSLTDANSPSASEHSSATTGSAAYSQKAFHSPAPQFGYVFDQMPEPINFNYSSGPPPQPSFRSGSIFVSPSTTQDRRFSYFPPDFTQTQSLPNAWNPSSMPNTSQPSMPAPPPAPIHAPTIQTQVMQQQPMIADPSYFMQSTPYSFGNHVFGDVNYDTNMRSGSLSQQQQIELMQSLETDGLNDINNYMNLSASTYESSIKL